MRPSQTRTAVVRARYPRDEFVRVVSGLLSHLGVRAESVGYFVIACLLWALVFYVAVAFTLQ